LNSENFQPQQGEMQGKDELSRPGNIQFSNPWPAKIFQLSLATATKVAKVASCKLQVANLLCHLTTVDIARQTGQVVNKFLAQRGNTLGEIDGVGRRGSAAGWTLGFVASGSFA